MDFVYNSKHYFYMTQASLLFSECENEKHQRSPKGKQGVPLRPFSTLQWVWKGGPDDESAHVGARVLLGEVETNHNLHIWTHQLIKYIIRSTFLVWAITANHHTTAQLTNVVKERTFSQCLRTKPFNSAPPWTNIEFANPYIYKAVTTNKIWYTDIQLSLL